MDGFKGRASTAGSSGSSTLIAPMIVITIPLITPKAKKDAPGLTNQRTIQAMTITTIMVGIHHRTFRIHLRNARYCAKPNITPVMKLSSMPSQNARSMSLPVENRPGTKRIISDQNVIKPREMPH